jgi:leucyl-tRNA synthetase
MIATTDWPKADPALVKSDTMTIGVQVNGKLRGTLDVSVDISEDALKTGALALDGVQRALEGKAPKRVIVVPRRIVNVVA